MADDSGQAGELTKVEITPHMIEAGKQALISSNALEYPCFATDGLIREVLEAALSARC